MGRGNRASLCRLPAYWKARSSSAVKAIRKAQLSGSGLGWAEILVEADGRTAGQTSRRRGHLPLPVDAAPVYDEDGNLTEDPRFFYTWDADNRLSSVEMRIAGLPAELPARRLELRYDAQGRRVMKRLLVRACPRNAEGSFGSRENTWQLVRETRFWYDG